MDIVVHGTKGGCHIFTPKKLSGLFDAGAGEGVAALGQQAYAISSKDNNTIFSRYEIIKDVRGDKRTGFVAYSLFLPNNKKLSGIDIRNLLDRVSDEYRKEGYIDDNNNLKDERENWAFLDRISNEYQTKLSTVSSDNAETLQSGAKDAAYIYYDDIEVLQKYFDERDQVEYSPFKLVFFVESDLRGTPADPLNALRHSENDLTGKIDLENLKYNLLFNKNAKGGVRIDVKVNGITLSNKTKIRQKSELEITWTKPYYIKVSKRGKCLEIDPKYTVIDNDEKTISITEIDLKPEEKTITLEIKNLQSNPVTDTEIQIGNDQIGNDTWRKISESTTTATFKGEDIGMLWTVLVKKGDSLLSDPISLSPENQEGPFKLYLNERKKVEIVATIDEKKVIDFTVKIKGKVINSNTTEIEFIGDEIDKTWNIEISKNGKSGYYSGDAQFWPKYDNKVHIELKKSSCNPPEQKIYSIYAGEHGTKSPNCPGYSNSSSGKDLDKNCIIPSKGYSFIYWKLDNDTLIAQYVEKVSFWRNSKVIAGLIVLIVYALLIIWVSFSSTRSNNEEQPINKSMVLMYIEGDALLINKLNSYKADWEEQKPQGSEESRGILSLLSSGKKNTDSNEYKEWDKVLQSINKAIAKRKLIDKANFAELKNQHYSPQQQEFETAVKNISSAKYIDVRNKLGNTSTLTLNQIADSIKAILTPKETTKEPKKEQNSGPENKLKAAKPQKNNQPATTQSEKITKSPVQEPQVSKDKTAEIVQYLRGNELNEQKLEEFKKTSGIPYPLKASIELCLDFWKLDGLINGKTSKTYWNFRVKVNADPNFKDSKLKILLDKMCEPGAMPSYTKHGKTIQLKNI